MINRVRPRLVTFDVTGTLLMTKLEEHYIEIGSQYGLLVEPRKLARSFKSNFAQLSKEHPIYGKHTGLGWNNWWRTIVHNVFREQHASVSTDTLDKVILMIIMKIILLQSLFVLHSVIQLSCNLYNYNINIIM